LAGSTDHRIGAGGVLVERERELATLDLALDHASRGIGEAVLVEGSAGLGKSRLLDEAIGRAGGRGMSVLRGRARETERDFPFGVALQLFEAPLQAAGEERERLLEGAAGLSRPLFSGEHLDGEELAARSPFSWLHGLYWLTVNFSNQAPLLVCVDDLQWSDAPSLRFLLYLSARLEGLRVALVTAARPPAAKGDSDALARLRGATGTVTLMLRPLALESVTQLVRNSVPAADSELCAVCAEVSTGNPFYVREMLLALGEDIAEPGGGRSTDRLRQLGGAAIGQAVLFRLVRAGADAVALVRALAVLGDATSLRRVAALAELELEAASAAVDALAAEDVLAAGEPLAFAHPLIRQSIYAEIPPAQRGIAHLRAARRLYEGGATAELVAAQLRDAPAAGEAWAIEALELAATRARAQGAPESAARYLQRALEEAATPQVRGRLLMELGSVEAAVGSEQAVDHLTAALELERDAVQRARVERLRCRALAGLGRARAAAEALERAIDELGDADPELKDALLVDYLSTAVFEPGLRQRAFERVAPLLASEPAGVTPAGRGLLAVLAMRSGQEAEPVERTIELADRAWAGGALLDDEGPDGSGWLMTDWALELAEDYERAKNISGAAIEAARRVGSINAFATASYFHGSSTYRQGNLAEAQADAEQAIEAERSGARRYVIAPHVLRANALIDRDQLDAAALTLSALDGQGREAMLETAWRLHARGRLEHARARPREALELLTQAGAWLTDRLSVHHTVLPWRSDAAHAALALGDRTLAKELIEPALALSERARAGVLRGRALRVLGLIDTGERGIELLERSVGCLSATQASLEHAHALADLGAALRRAGRRVDCRAPLLHALDLARRLDAVALAQHVREELAATGARPRRELISGVDSLTPSERRIARLAAEGHTNPQIAQGLFVTPKTVEYHLRHVYQKLDISGRGELAGALAPKQPSEQSMPT
jgi:DNA-binding CsgD family transcriptional regulator